jgi:hypothetical protein
MEPEGSLPCSHEPYHNVKFQVVLGKWNVVGSYRHAGDNYSHK